MIKKNKILKIIKITCLCLSLVCVLFLCSNNKTYAKTNNYENYNYNLIKFNGSKTTDNNSIKFNEKTFDYTFTHTYDGASWGTINLMTLQLKQGDIIYMKSFGFVKCGISLETFIDGSRKVYEKGNENINAEFIIEETAIFNVLIYCDPTFETFTIENFKPYIGYKNVNNYIPNLDYIYNEGYLDNQNLNGIWGKIYTLYLETDNSYEFDVESLIQNKFLIGKNLMLYTMGIYDNESYNQVSIEIEFEGHGVSLTEISLFLKGGQYRVEIYDSNEINIVIDTSWDMSQITYQTLSEKYSNIGEYIWGLKITASSPDALNTIINDSSYSDGFNNGYVSGIEQGKAEGYNEGYNNGLNDVENNINNYNEGYNKGKAEGYNEGYNEGIENDVATDGLKTLFGSILSYPVNMIRSVFNFEFMGVNISGLIMFIVSIGIVAFVIKFFLK